MTGSAYEDLTVKNFQHAKIGYSMQVSKEEHIKNIEVFLHEASVSCDYRILAMSDYSHYPLDLTETWEPHDYIFHSLSKW